MKINHIAMYVKDLEKSKNFFIKYFGAKSNELYHNKKTNFKSYFLSFDDETRLEIMNKPEIENKEIGFQKVGYIHIAFSLGSKESVNDLTEKLRNDGYKILSEPRTTGDGYYESCILDTEGNEIELTV
ncbi:MAG: glyoxalase [Fusobacteriales bacterium]|nr:MAG: glyoxalase [Fusobacteriales bacterium]